MKKSKAKIPEEVRQVFVAYGRLGGLKGGKVTASRRTPEQRKAAARRAVLARWKKRRTK